MAMPRARPDPDDLHSYQRFRGTLAIDEDSMPVRFRARIGADGEAEIDIPAFRLTKETWFVKSKWNADRRHVPEFRLAGESDTGLRFETDSLTITSLQTRVLGRTGRNNAKAKGECGAAAFSKTREEVTDRPVLKLHLKGFECFPALHATCPLGKVMVAGATKLETADRLSGFIHLEAPPTREDGGSWRAEAEPLLEHLRRFLSFAASMTLQAPLLEFGHGFTYRAEIISQTKQERPVMRVFHKLDQQDLLEAAVTAWFDPPVAASDLAFAIEWFAMPTTYAEVRLVNAMTALENLIDTNLPADDKEIEPGNAFKPTRRALRRVLAECLVRWAPERAEAVQAELGAKLLDLNRRSLFDKLQRLAARWQVPLDGISEAQIRAAIVQRNAIVHQGRHREADDTDDLWDHMTIIREIVVRFLMSAIGYRGRYISHVGGYHFAHFPPGEAPEVPVIGDG